LIPVSKISDRVERRARGWRPINRPPFDAAYFLLSIDHVPEYIEHAR
jgi:hypothetical protein